MHSMRPNKSIKNNTFITIIIIYFIKLHFVNHVMINLVFLEKYYLIKTYYFQNSTINKDLHQDKTMDIHI
jgi:hypothetical protein